MTKEVILKSGAKLKITLSPFHIAKNLYQAALEEVKGLKLDPNAQVDVNFLKDIFCIGLSSKKIEAALNECMKRVTYNDLKIDDNTFENVDARSDYMEVCFEVAKENILPFTKSLSAQYAQVLEMIKKSQA